MKKNKHKRKRSQAGRSARGRRAGGEERGGREKILRGSANADAPPPEPSQSELEGDVREGRIVTIRGRTAVIAGAGTTGAATAGDAEAGAVVAAILRKSTRVPHPESNALAVGDRVRYLHEGDEPFVITEVLPRRTRLARIRQGRLEQVIAANVDACAIVASAAEPSFKPGLVDRFLISAREGGLRAVLVLNKTDLADPAAVEAMVAPYRAIGITVLPVSAERGDGLEALRDLCAEGTTVLSGQSGVGKSSLLNRIIPDLEIRTNEVYGKAGKGRHTTTSSTLYELPGGGAVIDTPGIRSFLLHAPSLESLHAFFPEIAKAAAGCRFADCAHAGEEGCAVPEAVEAGRVDADRLRSYASLREEIDAG